MPCVFLRDTERQCNGCSTFCVSLESRYEGLEMVEFDKECLSGVGLQALGHGMTWAGVIFDECRRGHGLRLPRDSDAGGEEGEREIPIKI